jgi:hypothetical protein
MEWLHETLLETGQKLKQQYVMQKAWKSNITIGGHLHIDYILRGVVQI